jgi:hypothetical protein
MNEKCYFLTSELFSLLSEATLFFLGADLPPPVDEEEDLEVLEAFAGLLAVFAPVALAVCLTGVPGEAAGVDGTVAVVDEGVDGPVSVVDEEGVFGCVCC